MVLNFGGMQGIFKQNSAFLEGIGARNMIAPRGSRMQNGSAATVILNGTSSVTVTFDEPFASAPFVIITSTAAWDEDPRVTAKSQTQFTATATRRVITFDWLAFTVDNAET